MMISALLVMIAAFTGVLTIGAATAVEDTGEAKYAWAALVMCVCSVTLSFIAGVLS